MEGQKKMIEHRGGNNSKSYGDSNVLRKNKKIKKEGEIIKGVIEATPAAVAVVSADEKWRYDASCSNSFELNVPVVIGGDHHYQEHEDLRAWLRPGMLVDEQMSWGSTWFSFWEADNANCNEFYNDVMEDDLWDLKSIQNTPR